MSGEMVLTTDSGVGEIQRLSDVGDLGTVGTVGTTAIIISLAVWIVFFTLHDQIYPSYLTGQDADGNDITLTVCPAPTMFEELYKDTPDIHIEPALDYCVTFISARGLDRLAVLVEWIMLLFIGSDDPVFCGQSGGVEICYNLCPVNDKTIKRTFGSIACLVYDNGRPDKPQVSLNEIVTEKLMLPISDTEVTSDYMCMKSTVGYTVSNFNVYCVQQCSAGLFPVQSNPSPNFCYHIYQGSFFEKITSFVAFVPSYIQETISRWSEYSFCPPGSVSSETGDCPATFPASVANLKGCRPDGKGVWSLPPGATSCLIFLNGHDWPVGATFLIAATSIAGTSVLGGAVGVGGIMGMGGTLECDSAIFCRVNDRCCRLVFTNNEFRCPSSC